MFPIQIANLTLRIKVEYCFWKSTEGYRQQQRGQCLPKPVTAGNGDMVRDLQQLQATK